MLHIHYWVESVTPRDSKRLVDGLKGWLLFLHVKRLKQWKRLGKWNWFLVCFGRTSLFPRLNTLEVGIGWNEDTNGCLNNLARILRFSPVLKKLEIRIGSTGDIDASSWIKVIERMFLKSPTSLSNCQRIARWWKWVLWQDAFAESMSLNNEEIEDFEVGLCFVF